MVKLVIGHKGTGKTKKMIDMANSSLDHVNGSVVFINKNHRLMYDLKYRIRVICMEDFEQITNIDEYIGFILGIISQDHDIEQIYIDSILRHAGVKLEDLDSFFARLSQISEAFGPEFIVSVSADREQIEDIVKKYEILN